MIDFSREDPVQTLKRMTGGTGPDRIIDAVGIDAESPGEERDPAFGQEVQDIAPDQPSADSRFRAPGDAPSQALRWEVDAIAKAGTLFIVGVYPPGAEHFPIGIGDEQEPHDQDGQLQPSQVRPRADRTGPRRRRQPRQHHFADRRAARGLDAYEAFDQRREGWHKVVLDPQAA